MPDEFIRPDADDTLDGWTDEAGGTTTIYSKIDESTASDSDYVQSPVIEAAQADLVVRLIEGASTEIAEWTHSNVSETFATAEQTLTTPEFEAITDFTDLSIELDDNAGSVYRFSLGDPGGALTEPVVVRYRYKKLVVEEETYEGPGDIVSGALAFWGLRAYSAASIGQDCCRIKRASDNAEQNFVTVADGGVDLAAITTFLSATTGKIMTLFDQTGNGHDVAIGDNNQRPVFAFSVIGSLPGLEFDNSQSRELLVGSFAVQSQPYTCSWVAKRTGNTSAYNIVIAASGGNVLSGFNNSSGTAAAYAGSVVTASAAENTFHAVQMVFDGASSDICVDGSSNTVSPGTGGLTNTNTYVGGDQLARCLTGYIQEGGIWPVGFDAGQKTSMTSNQTTYWGL